MIFTLKTCFNCVHFGQVGFKWRVNNQDIRLLDVTTNQPQSLKQKKEKQKANASFTMTEHVVEAERKEEFTVDVSGLPETPSVENEDPLLFSRAH